MSEQNEPENGPLEEALIANEMGRILVGHKNIHLILRRDLLIRLYRIQAFQRRMR